MICVPSETSNYVQEQKGQKDISKMAKKSHILSMLKGK